MPAPHPITFVHDLDADAQPDAQSAAILYIVSRSPARGVGSRPFGELGLATASVSHAVAAASASDRQIMPPLVHPKSAIGSAA